MHQYCTYAGKPYYWEEDRRTGLGRSLKPVLPPGPPLPDADPIPFEAYPEGVIDEYIEAVNVCRGMNRHKAFRRRGLAAEPVVDGSLVGPRGVLAGARDPRERLRMEFVCPRVLIMAHDRFPVRGDALATLGRGLFLFFRPLDGEDRPLPAWIGQRWLGTWERGTGLGEFVNHGRLTAAGDWLCADHDEDAPATTGRALAEIVVEHRAWVDACVEASAWREIPEVVWDRSVAR